MMFNGQIYLTKRILLEEEEDGEVSWKGHMTLHEIDV